MATVCVGLDLSSSTIAICALDKETGRTVVDREFPTSERNLIEAIQSIPGKLEVTFECGELAPWAKRILKASPNVIEIAPSHAKSNRHIACDPLKRDRLDARKQAEMQRADLIHVVHLPDTTERTDFKRLVQHYENLTRQEVRLKNRLKSQFRVHGIFVKGQDLYTQDHFANYLKQVPSEIAQASLQQQFHLLTTTLAAQNDALKLLRKVSKLFPEILRFMNVPGIGLVLACRFSAYIDTPERFQTRQKLWRYCRLGIANPMTGGQSIHGQRLDWNGCPVLKDLSRQAFKAAVLQSKTDNAFKVLHAASLERTHNAVHARLNIQRKILLVLWTMWLNNEDYDEAKLLNQPKGKG